MIINVLIVIKNLKLIQNLIPEKVELFNVDHVIIFGFLKKIIKSKI
jgi:hypothetical protein